MYKKLYYYLFNMVSDAIEMIDNGQCNMAREILIKAQQETEEIYISAHETKTQH